jgi:hypothetical protein
LLLYEVLRIIAALGGTDLDNDSHGLSPSSHAPIAFTLIPKPSTPNEGGSQGKRGADEEDMTSSP